MNQVSRVIASEARQSLFLNLGASVAELPRNDRSVGLVSNQAETSEFVLRGFSG